MAVDFITYMRNVAVNLKDIGHIEDDEENMHFFRCTSLAQMDELLQNMSVVKFPALIVHDTLEGSLFDNGGAGYLDGENYFFYVVNHVAVNDFDAQEQAIKDCKSIMKKIIGKMRHDRINDFKIINNPLTNMKYLETNSFNYFSVGPIGDNCFGVYVSFTISEPDGIIYTANDWIS